MATWLNVISCWICHRFTAPSLKAVLSHIAAVHAHDHAFHTTCGIDGCLRSYSNFFSFKKHVYRKHREYLTAPPQLAQADKDLEESDSCQSPAPDTNLPEDGNPELPGGETNSIAEKKRQSALFILRTKLVCKMSQTAINDILPSVSALLENKLHYLQNELEKILSTVPAEYVDSVNMLFQSPEISEPFHGLETRHKQDQYIKEEFGLVVRVHVHMYSAYNSNYEY